MFDERQGNSGMNMSFNPDAPTEDQGGRTPAPASPRQAQRDNPGRAQGFNPDLPTDDSDSGWNSPSEPPKVERPSANRSFNPDAETEGTDNSTNQARPAEKPFKSNFTSQPGTPGNQGGSAEPASGPSSQASAKPFKPMGVGFGNQGRQAPTVQAPVKPALQNNSRPAPQQRSQNNNAWQAPVAERPVSRPPAPGFMPDGRSYQPDHRSSTLQDMVNQEKQRYDAEMVRYQDDLKRWKGIIWVPFAALAGLVLLALLAGAFAGSVGVIFVILVFAAAAAILAATGKLKCFMRPRKPKQQQPEMETPELTSVYSVRLRLKSINLPKPVEVTIRREEQLLGCDAGLCIQPLTYKGISHRHCTIISKHQHGHTTYYIRDEGSKNGTQLNDKKLDPGIEYPLQIGDLVTLAGRYQFKVLSDAY